MNILFGPYGCLLSSLGFSHNLLKIKEKQLYRTAVELIARGYLSAGATLPCVNAFFLRSLLIGGQLDLYKELLALNLEALLAAIGKEKFERIALCLGPAGDGYMPKTAPDTPQAFLFAKLQYELCLQVIGSFNLTTHDVVFLHETIGTHREALGIAQAAKACKIPFILSFIVTPEGRLLDGKTIESTILRIDQETSQSIEGFSLNCCSPYAFDRVATSFKNQDLVRRLIGFYPNSYDADPTTYEQDGDLIEPKKADSLKTIARCGRQYNLKFIGGCCGFGHQDIKRLVTLLPLTMD